MIATMLRDLFATAVASLPTLFLIGAPHLLVVIGTATLVDAKWKRERRSGGARPPDGSAVRHRSSR